MITRTAAERMASPERLNLDRRGLQACPLLQGEERLRLLNYQNNSIRVISNLHTLPYLIFLDLYNNHLTHISGLEQVAARSLPPGEYSILPMEAEEEEDVKEEQRASGAAGGVSPLLIRSPTPLPAAVNSGDRTPLPRGF